MVNWHDWQAHYAAALIAESASAVMA